jgi:hypothetical protein
MMENKYYITNNQLRDLSHFQQIFDRTSENIKQLCLEDKHDIEMGFELGKIYHTLRDQHLYMLSLLTDVKNQSQEINNNKPEFDNDREW